MGGSGWRSGRGRRGSAAHAPVPLARRLVGVRGAVIAPLVSPVRDAREGRAHGRPVARAHGGEDHARDVGQAREALAQGFRGRCRGEARLDQAREHVAVPVNGPPQVPGVAIDPHGHRGAGPRVAGVRPPPPGRGVPLAELPAPPPDRLGGHAHAALGAAFRPIAIAAGAAERQPHGRAADFRWEAAAFVAGELPLAMPMLYSPRAYRQRARQIVIPD